MLYRNSFAAHSGHEKFELAKSILIVNPAKNYELTISQERAQPDYIAQYEDISFHDLIHHALETVREKQDKVHNRIVEEILADAECYIKMCKNPKGLVVQLNNGV